MGVPGNANALLLRSAAAAGGYQVSRSLRFNSADSANLTKSFGSDGSRTTWTWSAWVKGGGTGTLFGCTDGGSNDSTYQFLYIDGDFQLHLNGYFTLWRWTTRVFRDPAAWWHIVLVWDTNNGTAQDRIRIYINGEKLAASEFGNANSNPSSGASSSINRAAQHVIGNSPGGYFNGYLADVYFVDGSALDASSFGETDATTGVWVPKAYSGTYGTNGFKLTFSDNSNNTASTLGKDSAGSNNWTPNNFSVTAGAGNDSLVDTPTSYGTDTGAGGEVRGNYATANVLNQSMGAFTAANGNLDVTFTGDNASAAATIIPSSGKWYAEVVFTTLTGYGVVGVVRGNQAGLWYEKGVYYRGNDGQKFIDSSTGSSYGATFGLNDVIGIALDIDGGTVTFYKNNTSQGAITLPSSTTSWTIAFAGSYSPGGGNKGTINFGQRAWAYTPPANHRPLVDTLLPSPVIAKPNTVFDVVLRTSSTATSKSVTGLNFSPDLLWEKPRSIVGDHWLADSIRGITKTLSSNTTNAEATYTSFYTSFNSDGYTIGTDDFPTGTSVVGWVWDAGSSTATNTQGSITSSVRANASAGFSIVTWNSDGTKTGTVGHGLGVKPKFVLAKTRNASDYWVVYTDVIDGSYDSFLIPTTNAKYDSGGTNFTTTVFNPYDTANTSSLTGVAYCWAPVSGYSSMGSFVSTNTSDNAFVFCGFRPRFVLAKSSSAVGDWLLWDAARNTYNLTNSLINPNLSDAEGTATNGVIDILSNGFKVRGTLGGANTFIYFAVAENPFQYARAR